ncbi:hypothetical protein TU94_03995 [Streptomyces cyaneogriseus subsp. noncyanogenus]|uniref:ABC transporter permease n=1 Tax=Streptomyces cyaneogriseus subsp. noncyanogenus TaxID=477245 RepID=A0A0C5G9J1_9ACTN|nr:hypothetical protein TU94_03995 [Streptomyces cyaneogriseus subsp. noncyanogenus]
MTTSTATAPAPAATATAARTPGSGRLRRRLTQWGFVAPAVVFRLLFFGYPLVRNVLMSFVITSYSIHYTKLYEASWKTWAQLSVPSKGASPVKNVFGSYNFV